MISSDGDRSAAFLAEQAEAVRRQIDTDLSARSKPGSFVYFFLAVIVALMTDYRDAHVVTVGTLIVSTLLLGTCQFVLAHRFARLYEFSPRLWKSLFVAIAITFAAMWGVFAVATLLFFGLNATFFLVAIMVAGTGAGAMTTLCPSRPIYLGYLGALIGPPLVAMAVVGASDVYGLLAGLSLYAAFLFFESGPQQQAYRSGLRNRLLLELRAEELSTARDAADTASRARSSG
jgi:hypothetical protein